jgi:NADPH2:quinone reductase
VSQRPGRGSRTPEPETTRAQRPVHVTAHRVIVAPDAAALRRIGGLIDSGAVHVEVQSVLPLAQAAEAHRLSRADRVRGKLVLSL